MTGAVLYFALDMQPIQIQIGDLIAKSPDEPQPKHRVRRKEKPAQGAGTE